MWTQKVQVNMTLTFWIYFLLRIIDLCLCFPMHRQNCFLYFVHYLYIFVAGDQVWYSLLCQSQNQNANICFFGNFFYGCFLREVKCRNFLPFSYYSFWYCLRIVFQYYANFKWHLWILFSFLFQIFHTCYNSSTNYSLKQWISLWTCLVSCIQVFETSLYYDEHIRDYVENSLWF